MHDLVIRGGRVWLDGALRTADVAVDGERVAAIAPERLPGREVVDADGLAVLPGMIDMHVHTRDPGFTYKEEFLTATRAAAAGGITTIVDMPSVEPPTVTLETFVAKRDAASRRCVVDWAHFAGTTQPAEIPRLAAAGAAGFKIYQVRGDPRLCMHTADRLLPALEAIAPTGLLCVAHPSDPDAFDALSERAAGRDHVALCRVMADELPWTLGAAALLVLAERAGARLHLAHTHAAGVLAMVRAAKAAGRPVSAELDLRFFEHRPEDLTRGPLFTPGGYVVADPAREEAIWAAFEDGTLDAITTDHAPHLREEVERQREDAWAAPWGNPQLEHAVPVLLTDVAEGRLSLGAFVRLTSARPAQLLGIYPRKGALRLGSDADVMLVDLERRWTITGERLYTKCGWTPYEGRTVAGRVEATILRGHVIMRGGEVLAEPGTGRYVRAAPA